MKLKKSLCSLFLLSLLLGTTAPAVVSATTDTSTSSTAATVDEPSTSSSSSDTSSSSSDVEEPSTSTSTEPSTSSSTEPSADEPSSTDEPSSSSSTEEPSTTSDSSSTKPSTDATDPSASDSPTAALEKAGILEAIIGKDDQYKVNNTTVAPYRSVVHLQMKYGSSYYVGSGVLIAPNLVLTVAHNVYDQKKGVWADSVEVTPARNGGTRPYGTYSSTTFYILRRYKTEGNVTPSSADMAVLKLNSNVSGAGYLSVSTSLSKNERIQIPGYPAYTYSKAGSMYTSYGNVEGLHASLIGHKVDTEGGNSGSPILNSRNQVVGVHSAGRYTYGRYGTYNWGRQVDSMALGMIDIAKYNKATTLFVASNREGTTGTAYRLYHAGIQRHLYTQSLDEANVLVTRGWRFEGAKFKTASSGTPVYRLYGQVMREHLYTTSANERDTLVRTGAWRAEGVAWYSSGKNKVYRLYNPALRVHLYTSDQNEVRVLSGRGWRNEGVAFYTN